jgi:hypothetical protein
MPKVERPKSHQWLKLKTLFFKKLLVKKISSASKDCSQPNVSPQTSELTLGDHIDEQLAPEKSEAPKKSFFGKIKAAWGWKVKKSPWHLFTKTH